MKKLHAYSVVLLSTSLALLFVTTAGSCHAVAHGLEPLTSRRQLSSISRPGNAIASLKQAGNSMFPFFKEHYVSTEYEEGTIRINCGGPAINDSWGRPWGADRFFSGGRGERVEPQSEQDYQQLGASSASNFDLVQSFRSWQDGLNNSYIIPLSKGSGLYWVRIFFVELQFRVSNRRSFTVYLNGFPVLSRFNVAAAFYTVLFEWSLPITTNNLTITFAREIGDPYVNAIEVVPQPSNSYRAALSAYGSIPLLLSSAYRIKVGAQHMGLDRFGRIWADDGPEDYPMNTSSIDVTSSHQLKISNTLLQPEFFPPVVYSSARVALLNSSDSSGRLAVALPSVFLGVKLLCLHFAELKYSNVGDRVVNVILQDELLLGPLDVVKEVGPMAAYSRCFTATTSTSNTALLLKIVPDNSSKYREASLNAFEQFDVMPMAAVPPPPPPPVVEATPPQESSGLSSAAIIGIALGSAAAVIVIGAALFCCLLRPRQDMEKKFWGKEGAELLNKINDRSVRFISLSEVKRATKDFSEERKLGEGGFGMVYRGEGSGQQWAVKRARKGSHQSIEEFSQEVDLISQLNHVNLVRLLGFCTEKNEQIFIYEFVANGSLSRFLHPASDSTLPPLTFDQRLKIAVGAARGLNYLHSFAKQPIIHRDIKAENILLDENMQAKVADFGLMKRIEDDPDKQATYKLAGTVGYLDPEYCITFEVTDKSDVYSYGVLLLELMTGRDPIIQDLNDPQKSISLGSWVQQRVTPEDWSQVVDKVMKGNFKEEILKQVLELGLDCVQQHGQERPSMAGVVRRLEKIIGGDHFTVDVPEFAYNPNLGRSDMYPDSRGYLSNDSTPSHILMSELAHADMNTSQPFNFSGVEAR